MRKLELFPMPVTYPAPVRKAPMKESIDAHAIGALYAIFKKGQV